VLLEINNSQQNNNKLNVLPQDDIESVLKVALFLTWKPFDRMNFSSTALPSEILMFGNSQLKYFNEISQWISQLNTSSFCTDTSSLHICSLCLLPRCYP
jgi:hypothetical protein